MEAKTWDPLCWLEITVVGARPCCLSADGRSMLISPSLTEPPALEPVASSRLLSCKPVHSELPLSRCTVMIRQLMHASGLEQACWFLDVQQKHPRCSTPGACQIPPRQKAGYPGMGHPLQQSAQIALQEVTTYLARIAEDGCQAVRSSNQASCLLSRRQAAE